MGTRVYKPAKADGVLLTTPRGSVLQCGCCDKVEVALGNAILSLAPADLDSVLEVIESFDVEGAPETEPPRREFILRTEHDQASFAFSRSEVMELRELVTAARARMRVGSALTFALPAEARRILH